jgi:hypothetical protein
MSLEDIKIFELTENPDQIERVIEDLNLRAPKDREVAELLESMYWETDRSRAFDRFHRSRDFQQIDKLLRIHCNPETDRICEVGAGNGAVLWSLLKTGYTDLSAVEPNEHRITGTGYLSSLPEASWITRWNHLADWHDSNEEYDVILTRNCVHHFQNIAMTAASIRKKMKPDGVWIMIREWFADTAQELYQALRDHPLCQEHRLYEWPFPASHYVESMEMAGFRLHAVVPAGYADNCLSTYVPVDADRKNESLTAKIDALLKNSPRRTKLLYRAELFANRYLRREWRRYTRPQAMIFRRVELRPTSS